MKTFMPYKRVLLGVSGGIAAYKSVDLVRRLKERGCEVRVVLTQGGKAFVNELTFQAVSGEPVHTEMLDANAEAGMGHIELAKWADVVLIAPATANEMAKLANGFASDLLSTLCLATEAPLVLAPAMNQAMWRHQATQENLHILLERGVRILGPGVGDQACGDVGPGRMLEPVEIADLLLGEVEQTWQGKSVVITAGPTCEPIDPVRFITNRSSGKMGYAIAEQFVRRGANVTLVSGPTSLPKPAGVERIDVETAEEMLDAVMEIASDSKVFVSSAAVADYRVAQVPDQKIKKSADTMSIELVKNPDVLATVSAKFPGVFTVGFAAETQNVAEYAKGKLEKKKLNMIAANNVSVSGQGFDSDQNHLDVFWKDGSQSLSVKNKFDLAGELVELITERFNASTTN